MTSFSEIISQFQFEFSKPLPGLDAQLLMAPAKRQADLQTLKYDENPKESSVLLLLYPSGNSIYIVLIKRADLGGHHSGQISLPGGKFEISDKDLVETALREAEEEVGIISRDVVVLGELTKLYIPVSNMSVLPVVGYLDYKPKFIKENTEVDEIIETKLSDLFDPKNNTIKIIHIRNIKIEAPAYLINEHIVWGATAMILSEFYSIVKNTSVLH